MDLDKQQAAAVHTVSNRVLVLAGAGSGKTRVLTERIAHLVENCKVSPFEIIAITFTKKAAGEMKERLENRVQGAHNLTVGTMHSVSLNLIQQFGEQIGLKPKQTTVYSPWEEAFLLKEIAVELGVYKGKSWKIPKKEIDQTFANYYERGRLPEGDDAEAIFKTFMARCRENNSVSYGGLLVGLEMLIPTIARYKKWRHVLVDEVQDLDPLQWRIINAICEAMGADLFCVGDDSQSIYNFRGAVPQYLIDHQHEFTIYQLQTNYRSAEHIVEAANRLIKNNVNRLPLEMIPVRDNSSAVTIERNMDSGRIAGMIGYALDDNAGAQFTVLSRNHILLQKLSKFLESADIKHNYVGQKTAITNSEEFRRFHAFLKLIVNPMCNMSFLLIKDIIGLDKRQYSKVRVRAITRGYSHFQAWVVTTVDAWSDFFEFCAACAPPLVDITMELWKLLENDDAYAPAVTFIKSWAERNPVGSVSQYLSWLATYDVSEEVATDDAQIQLMTVHASKGLEWPNVIIAGCNEGIIPSKQAVNCGDIEDERRLMYVAITRARDNLLLAVRPEKKEGKGGRIYENPVSRFVGETA